MSWTDTNLRLVPFPSPHPEVNASRLQGGVNLRVGGDSQAISLDSEDEREGRDETNGENPKGNKTDDWESREMS